MRRFSRRAARLGLLALGLASGACDESTGPPVARTRVIGTVQDAQSNTSLFFYDEELNPLDVLRVVVRGDGSYGPLAFTDGDFIGAGTALGFTTGQFTSFTILESDTLKVVDFDLDPITVPLVVGNRWTYDELIFSPAPDTLTVTVEITAQQPGAGVPAVFTVEERRTGPTGPVESSTYFLAQDALGIRKSADPVIDSADELLLRLPATLGTSWSTVDFATGASLQKRITAFECDESGCVETPDFTIAVEPAGTFMSVSERHAGPGGEQFVTTFSDIGIVDSFVQNAAGQIASQRLLRAFTAGSSGPPPA